MFPGPAAALAVQHNELMKYNHKSFCFLYEERNAEYSKQENPKRLRGVITRAQQTQQKQNEEDLNPKIRVSNMIF